MKKHWTIVIHGREHTVEYKKKVFKSYVIVDGQERRLKSANPILLVYDEAFNIEGTEVHFTTIGNRSDVAVDGTYIGSNEPYKPFPKGPSWLIASSIALFVIGLFFSGALGVLVALLGALFGTRASLLKGDRGGNAAAIAIIVLTLILEVLLFFFVSLPAQRRLF